MRTVLSILSILLLGACVGAQVAGTDTVGPGYVTGGGEWNTGGGISAVVRVLPRDGRVAVCGAWTTDRQSAVSLLFNEDVMAAASVYLAGSRLVQNLTFMARYPEGTETLRGRSARCALTALTWQPRFAAAHPVLRFPRMVFPQDGGDAMTAGSGDSVVFRQTERPDMTR